MPTLTPAQLRQLETDKDEADQTHSQQDRATYYTDLLSYGFNYGALARGVVLDNTLSGIIANGFLALRSSGYRTVTARTDGSAVWYA